MHKFTGWTTPYLITHGETSVVGSGSPQVGDKANVEQIHQVEPAIQHEPPRFPVLGHKAGIAAAGKGKGVEKEEAKDDDDTDENAPPEFFVHQRLGLLLPINEILHCRIERVQCPHVEGRQCSREGKNDQKDKRSGAVWGDRKTSNRVDDSKDKVSNRQDADVYHRAAQRGFDHTVAHADNQQEEERECVATCIQNSHKDHQSLCHGVQTMSILIICALSVN